MAPAGGVDLRVLVIGDSDGPSGSTALALEDPAGGFTVRFVSTCEEALDLLPSVDCVVLHAASGEGAHPAIDQFRGEVREVPLVMVGADPPSLASSIRSAVDRARMRGALQDREDHHRAVMDAIGEALVVQDTEGHVLSINGAGAQLLETEAENAIGRKASDVWRARHPDGHVLQQHERPGRRAVTTGIPVRNQLSYLQRPDGTKQWLETSSYPLVRPGESKPYAVVSTARDVTERVEAEKAVAFQARLLNAVGQSIIATDPEGHITYWNKAAQAMYGWCAEEVLGRNILEITVPEDDRIGPAIMAQLMKGESWSGDYWTCRRDGSRFPVMVTDTPILDEQGRLEGIIGVSTDVSERHAFETALEEDRRRLAEAQRVGNLGSFEYVFETATVVWSEELRRLLGLEPSAEADVDRYVSLAHPADRLHVQLAVAHSIQDRVPFESEHRIVRPDGTVRWVYGRGRVTDDGTRIMGTILDITERKRAEEALAHQALHDPLTGLPNRLLLDDRLEQALGRTARRADSVAVMFLDLDRFKVVNDALGHAAGDKLLVQVAERVRALLRPQDTLARFAGDELVILCEDIVGSWEASRVAKRIVESFEDPFWIDDRDVFVSASVGVALAELGATPESVLRDADAAMYHAKERGGARFEFADDELRNRATAKLETHTALRRAIDRGELVLHYQPVVRTNDGTPVGFEALVRWPREDGLVPPSDFIPIAEETGLIVPLGRWVLERALRDLAAARAERPELASIHMAVNLSAGQLHRGELIDEIVGVLAETGTDPELVHLEITESVLMDDADNSIQSLVGLKAIGVHLAVDDFGTGYSTLSYLKRLPIDTLKIDRSFVDGLGVDAHDSSIVRAIVSLAGALDLKVLAEGVETECQRAQLEQLGCPMAQGFHFAGPMPAAEAFAWAAARLAPSPVV